MTEYILFIIIVNICRAWDRVLIGNMKKEDKLIVKGAREHNLKNIDIEIPRNKLVVITGLSGSGKSSLAFDTIYAEAALN